MFSINLVDGRNYLTPNQNANYNQMVRHKRSFDILPQTLFDPLTIEELLASKAIKRAAMGVDLPDYILHYRSNLPNYGDLREKMQKGGK
uniref:Uncharacterized protein n=2 Tax=Tetranychus urticae TaxID=32264 RepID=T1K4Q8_TETUR